MKNSILSFAAASATALFLLGGCGSDSKNSDEIELESSGKTIIFYSASTNDHLAYNVDEGKLTNLNDSSDDELINFNMNANDKGKLFVWVDDKGDDNASNDEEKVLMFDLNYSYANDGNATWEDFYYLGHFHEEEEDGETHYHLAAHANEEFNVTEGKKFMAMQRLNAYLESEAAIEASLSTALSAHSTTLCGYKTVINDNGTRYYAMGVDGTMYIYTDTFTLDDQVVVTDSCQENGMGISSVSEHDENGVVVFEANSQKLYLVDSHDDGVYHVHSSWDVSDVIGSAHAQMMASLIPVGYESDEEHDHDH